MKTKIIISVMLSLFVLAGCTVKNNDVLGLDEAKAKAEDFINKNLMSEGSEAKITEISEEGSLYKVQVDVGGGQIVDSYLSKDGKKFFPQALIVKEVEKQMNTQSQGAEAVSSVQSKSDKPNVELFVMSHCPFGTQIEKGIIPVVELLGEKIDFELKFCDYAMHDKKELDEQVRQYCIQKEMEDNFFAYLKCFLEDGDSNRCIAGVGIDNSKLSSCIEKTDKKYKVTEMYNDKNTWRNGTYPIFAVYEDDVVKYGVGGSPTLIINGETISSARDPQSLLGVICSAFNEAPEECLETLSTVNPSAGFGSGTSDSSSGGCQ